MRKFIDEAKVFVRAGNGGAGAIAFLREKYRPFGGPAGGDGGRGGSVIFEVDEGMSTLLDFKYKPRVIAGNGEPGRGKEQNGRAGADAVVRVPPGTRVVDDESGELIADLVQVKQQAVICRGGRGGLGNTHFATSTSQAPRIATPGTKGEERQVRLQLHLVADVGLVGLPNAGKSTLLAALSAARPRIAPYPFTTLVPNLGRVVIDQERGFTVADIPGLIEGAHLGHGLGVRFLRHLARTRMLVFVVDASGDPEADLETVRGEIGAFDPALLGRPAIIALNKIDLLQQAQIDRATRSLAGFALEVLPISARDMVGIDLLREAVAARLAAEALDAPASLSH